MKIEKQEDKQPIEFKSEKNAYTSPKFIKYGDVRSLTQAGLSGSNENSKPDKALMAASDRSTKENIVKIGDHPCGFGLYLFNFKPEYSGTCGHVRQFGVMADEVEKVIPNAVSKHPEGYKMVNYAMLGIRRFTH